MAKVAGQAGKVASKVGSLLARGNFALQVAKTIARVTPQRNGALQVARKVELSSTFNLQRCETSCWV